MGTMLLFVSLAQSKEKERPVLREFSKKKISEILSVKLHFYCFHSWCSITSLNDPLNLSEAPIVLTSASEGVFTVEDLKKNQCYLEEFSNKNVEYT